MSVSECVEGEWRIGWLVAGGPFEDEVGEGGHDVGEVYHDLKLTVRVIT